MGPKRLIFLLVINIFFLPSIVEGQEGGRSKTPAEVVVTVDLNTPDIMSQFEIGVTHVSNRWDKGHPEAVERVIGYLGEAVRYHSQHIYGWGVDDPMPEGHGKYKWDDLDERMALFRRIPNAIPVLCFCGAPVWMKDYNPKIRWQIEIAPRDENIPDFAELCAKVAARYPDVKNFIVWNEFKGYWIGNKRDVQRFTIMYNAVYDSVKNVRPDALIGGPYTSSSISEDNLELIDYWIKNKVGADFFTYDGWLEGWPPGSKTEEWMMENSDYFGRSSSAFSKRTNLPMWITEFYGGSSDNPYFKAANHASAYLHSLKAGTRMALLWDSPGLGHLFTRTDTRDGGMPIPHYYVVLYFNKFFGPGTQLYKAESSSKDVEVLASASKILLINKLPRPVRVDLNDRSLTLNGYEVRLMETQ